MDSAGIEEEGRPSGTWRKMSEEEIRAAGRNRNEVKRLSHDCEGLRGFVGALRSTWNKRIK